MKLVGSWAFSAIGQKLTCRRSMACRASPRSFLLGRTEKSSPKIYVAKQSNPQWNTPLARVRPQRRNNVTLNGASPPTPNSAKSLDYSSAYKRTDGLHELHG